MANKTERRGGDVIDLHRKVSLDFIQQTGNYAVMAPRGEKNPGKGWDPKTNSKARSDQAIHDLRSNDLNLGIHLYGKLVDVDVDSDAPFLTEALDNFLPSCSHIWGRQSRPRTHRVYQLNDEEPYDPSDHVILRRLEKIEEAAIELRGGQQTRGEYSLLPGSIHPSGEKYEWSDLNRAQNSPSVTDLNKIIKGIRFAGAVAVIAPFWVEGSRNSLVMALSGFLYKAHEIAEGLGVGAFSMDKDEADRFLRVLLSLADGDAADRGSRLSTFQMTWKKAENGTPVVGASTLAEITGDSTIVGKLYTLLTDSPDIAAIEEFTSRFAIWQGPGTVIDMEQAKKGAAKPIMTRQAFVNSFSHKAITAGGKRRLLADILFHLETTTRVAGLTFHPGSALLVDTREGKKVNQWSGFEMTPWKEPVDDDAVEPFTSYVMGVLANDDPGLYEWIIGWVANIFQDPNNKPKTALVLVGKPGAGKSWLGHEILQPMIGETHSASTKSVENITRGFNVLFDNKLFVQCDEAMNNRQKATAAKLKSIITDPYMEIEPKGVDPYLKPNLIRFLFTSNDIDDAVNLEDGNDDRRYTVAEVSDRYVDKNEEYWIPFSKWLDDNRPKVMRWLMDRPTNMALISWPMQTRAKTLMQQRSWPVFDAWLATWIARGHPLSETSHEAWYDAVQPKASKTSRIISRDEWPELINMSALVRDFASFARYYGKGEHQINEVQMGAQLVKRGLKRLDAPRTRTRIEEYDQKRNVKIARVVALYPAPPRDKVIDYLSRHFGFEADQAEELEMVWGTKGPGPTEY